MDLAGQLGATNDEPFSMRNVGQSAAITRRVLLSVPQQFTHENRASLQETVRHLQRIHLGNLSVQGSKQIKHLLFAFDGLRIPSAEKWPQVLEFGTTYAGKVERTPFDQLGKIQSVGSNHLVKCRLQGIPAVNEFITNPHSLAKAQGNDTWSVVTPLSGDGFDGIQTTECEGSARRVSCPGGQQLKPRSIVESPDALGRKSLPHI